MKKSPITVRLQYFPSEVTNPYYRATRIDGAATVFHPKGGNAKLHVGDCLDENDAEKLSTMYKVVTIL